MDSDTDDFSYEYAVKYFRKYGCKLLLSKKAFNKLKLRDKLKFLCICDNKRETSFYHFKTGKHKCCKQCASFIGRTGITKKEFFDNFVKEMSEKGFEILSELKSFDNCLSKMLYRCKCSDIKESTIQTLKTVKGCQKCSARVKYSTILERCCAMGCQLSFTENEYNIIYKDKHTRLNIICACKNLFSTCWLTMQSKKWSGKCERCRLKYDENDVKYILSKNGCVLISEYEKSHSEIEFMCICGNIGKTTFKEFLQGRRCNDKECINIRRIKTVRIKYGCDNVFQNEDIKKKIKDTMMEKYGVEHIMRLPEIIEKTKKTNKEKYGQSYAFNQPEIYEKIKETNKEKYGVEYPLQNNNIKDKSKKTCLKKYGVEYPFQEKGFLDKVYATNLEKYGTKSFLNSNEGKRMMMDRYGSEIFLHCEEFKRIMIERYGVEHAMQNMELFLKAQRNAYKMKSYIFPSGREENVQGYEPFCLNDLLDVGIKEENILVQRKVPIISYFYKTDRKYFPDIYIKDRNLLIEVKSCYTYKKQVGKNIAKAKASISSGYDFAFAVYSEKAKLIAYKYYKANSIIDEYFTGTITLKFEENGKEEIEE